MVETRAKFHDWLTRFCEVGLGGPYLWGVGTFTDNLPTISQMARADPVRILRACFRMLTEDSDAARNGPLSLVLSMAAVVAYDRRGLPPIAPRAEQTLAWWRARGGWFRWGWEHGYLTPQQYLTLVAPQRKAARAL